jgi:anti-sigma-K factor RskA
MNMKREPEPQADLVGAYAFDAVDGAERDAFEQLLARDEMLRTELHEHYETLSVLASGLAETPPERVWQGVAARIGSSTEDAARTGGEVVPLRVRSSAGSRFSRVVVSFGAVAALVAVVLGVRVVQLDNRVAELDAALAGDRLGQVASQALAAPDSTVAVLAGAAGSGIGEVTIVLDGEGTGYVFGDSLPALDAAHTYQLWAIEGERVISAGVLGREPGIAPFRVVGSVTGFAITVEEPGGVVSSSNAPAAVWLADA